MGEIALHHVNAELRVDYRGVQILHAAFGIKESTVEKFAALAGLLSRRGEAKCLWTRHRHQIVAGLAAYVEGAVRRLSPSSFPLLFSSLSATQDQTATRCPPAILKEITEANKWLREQVPWDRLLLSPTALAAVTDSSLQGWGACLISRFTTTTATTTERVAAISGRWKMPTACHSINVLELMAAARTSEQYEYSILITDNTTVMSAMRHRYSAKPGIMAALRQMKRLPRDVWYVRSADNEADALSRSRPPVPHNPRVRIFASPRGVEHRP